MLAPLRHPNPVAQRRLRHHQPLVLHRGVVDPRPAARALHDALIRPMEKDLRGAGAKTILWHLDGPLRYVPMGALYAGDSALEETLIFDTKQTLTFALSVHAARVAMDRH